MGEISRTARFPGEIWLESQKERHADAANGEGRDYHRFTYSTVQTVKEETGARLSRQTSGSFEWQEGGAGAGAAAAAAAAEVLFIVMLRGTRYSALHGLQNP
jgi:hypothetical protein